MEEEKKIQLKKLIKELESYRGRKTELISYYLPPNYDINSAIAQISAEIATARNIKSDITRNNVIDALERVASALRNIGKIGKNGLVVFSGNVGKGKDEFKVWVIEPPEPLNLKIYRCDNQFLVEPLKELLKEKEIFGLIVLDSKEATIGILRGKNIEVIYNDESNVPSKTVKGGWSQQRYKRIREQALEEWLKKIGEKASQIFLQNDVKGILVGGPGPIKEEFVKNEYLDYRLRDKIIAIKDVGYTNEYGLQELVNRSEEELSKTEVIREKTILKKFFESISKLQNNVVYNIKEVLKYLEIGALEELIISEDFNFGKIKLFCKNCGNIREEENFLDKIDKKCNVCGREMEIEEFNNYFDKILEIAKNYNTKVYIVSSQTSEGQQFLSFGGIGGFSRFKLE
ncbi:MAG: peptide chain release factor aRF-1 [Candidatus Methanomethylicaceae archaeon]